MAHPQFRRVERQARRMHDMMDRLEVDPGKLARLRQGEAYAEARTRCLDCVDADKCLRWLETFDLSPDRPDFCPNIELFETCLTGPKAP